MPTSRPRASFEPIPPDFDLKKLVENTPNFNYVDRISVEAIDQEGRAAFEKLILHHVIIGGMPLVVDGFETRLDPWTFTSKWLRDNCGDKHETAWDLKSKDALPLTMAHYLNNMGMLTNQFHSSPSAYKESKRQRVYLKDIDCPAVWQNKLWEQIPSFLSYLNESTGEIGGPGAVPESNAPGQRLGKGIARAGDLMSSLPPDMRAENLMCYIGHEGTYTPAHREMCASLGHNIMVEASDTVSEDGKAEKPGSSIWFMTESKDRHLVSEFWTSVLGHDIEVENHFAQVVAWKKAPFKVYVVEQRPGDFILIPPLAPHQVWNRGTRTMKVAWNRTTAETLEMALNEALPHSRIVCRDEQYKNKAIIYYTLQKYGGLISLAQSQTSRMAPDLAAKFMKTPRIRQLCKDFRRLFNLHKHVLVSEMFNPDDRESPKSFEYIPFDGNVTCAYCRCNIFNRFLTCPSCKDMLGHNAGDSEGDPYDVCMDCYAMGRSCGCISNLKWVEQFRWKELAAKYESWRKLIIALDGGRVTESTPLPILEERRRHVEKTLAEVCKDQLKRRPWKDLHRSATQPASDLEEEEEIVVNDDGTVKKTQKKRSKAWYKNNSPCHVCNNRHPNWKMAPCTTCERWWCYGTLFRGWDKMPIDIMSDPDWSCPHCLGICFAGGCKREGKMTPYEPKGTLLGHDTKKVADVRSVEVLVDFSVSNLNWLKGDDPENRTESRRLKNAGVEAEKAKSQVPALELDDDDNEDRSFDNGQVQNAPIDPTLASSNEISFGGDDEADIARKLQHANLTLPDNGATLENVSVDAEEAGSGYTAVTHAGFMPPANMYPQPDESNSYSYPGYSGPASGEAVNEDVQDRVIPPLRPFKRQRQNDVDDEDISMSKFPKMKRPRLFAAGFRSTDLASDASPGSASKARSEAQRQFEREKERKALDKAKSEGRFIMLQAALKGKRRIVRLKIPAVRLSRLLSQYEAKNTTAPHVEVEAEDIDEDPSVEMSQEDSTLLKSDIRSTKERSKEDQRKYYEQRQRDGFLLNSKTKKARVPVEKDSSYGSGHRGPRTKKTESGPHQRRKRTSYSTVEFEEVDIGSDDEAAEEVGDTNGHITAQDRRSLPGYMSSRHAEDQDEDFPTQLSNDYKEVGSRPRPRPIPRTAANTSRKVAPSQRSISNDHSVSRILADGAKSVDVRHSAAESELFFGENSNALGLSNNPGSEPIQEHHSSLSSPGQQERRPKKNVTFGVESREESVEANNDTSAQQSRSIIEEENRLAKLRALELLD